MIGLRIVSRMPLKLAKAVLALMMLGKRCSQAILTSGNLEGIKGSMILSYLFDSSYDTKHFLSIIHDTQNPAHLIW